MTSWQPKPLLHSGSRNLHRRLQCTEHARRQQGRAGQTKPPVRDGADDERGSISSLRGAPATSTVHQQPASHTAFQAAGCGLRTRTRTHGRVEGSGLAAQDRHLFFSPVPLPRHIWKRTKFDTIIFSRKNNHAFPFLCFKIESSFQCMGWNRVLSSWDKSKQCRL